MSTGSSWDLPFVKARITSLACLRTTLSLMVNPQSAITISPGRSLSRKPQFSVTNLSETWPPQASKTNRSLGGYTNKNLDNVVVFITGKCLCSSKQVWWSFNEHLKTVNDNSCFFAKGILETLGHCLAKLIPVWPVNKGKQSLVHYHNQMEKYSWNSWNQYNKTVGTIL